MDQAPRILVVEDEPKICQLLEVLLRREGYEIRSVYNAVDGLADLATSPCDLVITDLKMPGMDGFEFVQRIKQFRRDLPVVMITGYATVETAVAALRHGADDYVTKPFDVDELKKVLARLLERSRADREESPLVEQVRRTSQEMERQRRSRMSPSRAGSASDAVTEVSAQANSHPTMSGPHAANHNLNRALKSALQEANRALDARAGSVMLREGDELIVRACEGERGSDLIGTRQPLHDGIAGTVARHGQPILVQDIHNDPRFHPTAGRSYRSDSFLCVPITQGNRILGVLNASDKRSGPFEEKDLHHAASVADRIASDVETALLQRSVEERCAQVIESVAQTLETKYRHGNGHSRRVRDYAMALAQAAGLKEDEMATLRRAAELHDIGMVGISERVLDKADRLDAQEQELIRAHPAVGERIVGTMEFLGAVKPLIRHHHERVDGAGYPDGLRGEAIPYMARILAIADAFDAMTSARPYREPMTSDQAAQELEKSAGAQFDSDLARLFCAKVISHRFVS